MNGNHSAPATRKAAAFEGGPPVDLTYRTRRRLIETIARQVIEHADELTALDQAIGDGDHGINMRRGFEAVLADLEGLAGKGPPQTPQGLGLAPGVLGGGASRPLFWNLVMQTGPHPP